MTDKKALDIPSIRKRVLDIFQDLGRYRTIAFLAFVALLYGFLLFQIRTLTTAQPSADAISSQVKATPLPHIDKATIKQLQSLQDNSVSVQALFDQARSNPFQ